jgi:hypothetical protein
MMDQNNNFFITKVVLVLELELVVVEEPMVSYLARFALSQVT